LDAAPKLPGHILALLTFGSGPKVGAADKNDSFYEMETSITKWLLHKIISFWCMLK
jgi:hypothetical protein